MPATTEHNHRLPNANTYWIRPGKLMAGEYPGHARSAVSRERLRQYLGCGVDFFLDLTEAGELRSYARFLAEVAQEFKQEVVHCRMPICDASVPKSRQYMRQILDIVDRAIADGHLVYVHCWGGVGRTGTVAGCYLVRHGLTGEQALHKLDKLWKDVEKSTRMPFTPETPAQQAWIRQWSELDENPHPDPLPSDGRGGRDGRDRPSDGFPSPTERGGVRAEVSGSG